MTPTTTIGTPAGVFLHSGPEELYREHQAVLEALGGTHTHLGADIGRAASYDVALLDVFWTAMAGYAHALAVARAEGVTAQELAPFAQGIAAILPPIFEESAREVDEGTYSGEGNPITSAASSMAHIVHASEEHGIDASVMRAAEGWPAAPSGWGTAATGSCGSPSCSTPLSAEAGSGMAGNGLSGRRTTRRGCLGRSAASRWSRAAPMPAAPTM
ncbi:hypothetical protein ACFQ0B_45915 [Nonomuraea thailandensis]